MFRTYQSWPACLLITLGFVSLAAAEPTATVHPTKMTLNSLCPQQQVVATVSVGHAHHDATPNAQWIVADPSICSVSDSGLVSGLDNGKTHLLVKLDQGTLKVPITVNRIDKHRNVSYRLDVHPLLSKAGCNQGVCHGALTGKGGFRLTLRGDAASDDLHLMTRDALGRRIDLNHPEESLLVRKATAAVPHEGGKRFDQKSAAYQHFVAWIRSGARDDADSAPTVSRLEIFPDELIIGHPYLEQQLVVTAHFADGTVRDVTRTATYETSVPTGLTVSPGGRVTAESPVDVAISAHYAGAMAVSRLVFLSERAGFADQPEDANNFIDELVHDRQAKLRLVPSPVVNDARFLRRAYLTAIGVLPTPRELAEFLGDTSKDKRSRLVDRLVDRQEFNDYWALHWADLLRNEEKVMSVKGVWSFRRWLVRQFRLRRPMDQTVVDLLTTTGSSYRSPAASFYRTNRNPLIAAESAAQVFLGYRLQCAKCHNHPFDVWRQDDYYGLAAYFSNVERKKTTNARRDRLDSHEINGDEFVYLSGEARIRQPVRGVMMSPRPLDPDFAPPAGARPPEDSLDELAQWLVGEPQFARNIANRVWFQLMGRGVVDPPDDFRVSNPPSNPELLESLADHFSENDFRIRPLVAAILKSKTFQRSCEPNETNRDDVANFSRYPVRLMDAEVLLDALSNVFEQPEEFRNAPVGIRAVQLPGVRSKNALLEAFGKPERLTTCECERTGDTTLSQSFQLINGPVVRKKLEASDNRLGRLLNQKAGDTEAVIELYAAALSRRPSEKELGAMLSYLSACSDKRQGLEDVAWALVNSKEFLLIH